MCFCEPKQLTCFGAFNIFLLSSHVWPYVDVVVGGDFHGDVHVCWGEVDHLQRCSFMSAPGLARLAASWSSLCSSTDSGVFDCTSSDPAAWLTRDPGLEALHPDAMPAASVIQQIQCSLAIVVITCDGLKFVTMIELSVGTAHALVKGVGL